MKGQPPESQPITVSHHDLSQLDTLRERLSTALRPYRCQVYLFGSWARGDSQVSSDVDIAVLHETPLPPGLLSQIRFDIEESSFLPVVDLVDLSQSTKTFRQRVLSEGVLWIDSKND